MTGVLYKIEIELDVTPELVMELFLHFDNTLQTHYKLFGYKQKDYKIKLIKNEVIR